ncbi:MAG TPA: TolC family protein [Verrucomicrobiae bacterium]|nr:TolC family protein [Verrucomicrobiae bacterium]
MTPGIQRQRGICVGSIFLGSTILLLAGCKGPSLNGEREARQQVRTVTESYRPNGSRPVLPVLTTNSNLGEYLKYALLNQPKVEAAYYEWMASVERITIQRSLPDPQITFQMDIQDVVTSLMPGLMMSFPGAGKLRAAGAVAAADSQAKYFAFKTASLESAYEVKRAYYRLYFLDEKIRVERDTLNLLSELEKLALNQNQVGKVTLQDVLRAQIEQDRLRTELANLEDSRGPLLAEFKAALGLRALEPAPPLPQRFESTSLDVTSEELFQIALEQNTRLKGMEADLHSAEAAIQQAYRARMPDASIGVMADVKMNPVLYRPWGTVSLPIWRDKLAAQVAEAQANKRAGEARLTAEQINLAIDFAQRSFQFREATRNLELLQNQLVPKQQQSLEVARSGYVAGQIDFFNLTDAEQTLLRFSLDEVEAHTQRELALVELSLIIEGMPPTGTPTIGSKAGGMGAAVSSMGASSGGMLPGGSSPPKKSGQGQMK